MFSFGRQCDDWMTPYVFDAMLLDEVHCTMSNNFSAKPVDCLVFYQTCLKGTAVPGLEQGKQDWPQRLNAILTTPKRISSRVSFCCSMLFVPGVYGSWSLFRCFVV